MPDDNINDALKNAISSILEVSVTPLSEYQLISQLREQGWSLPTAASDSLALFQSHFLVYHALYRLQIDYWQQDQYWLEISALSIQLHKASQSEPSATQVDLYRNDTRLREYYIDLTNMNTETEESVENLIHQFWHRFVADEDKHTALSILGLALPITSHQVKHRYRQLAMKHHPDRGGSQHRFQEINWAFGVLQRCL